MTGDKKEKTKLPDDVFIKSVLRDDERYYNAITEQCKERDEYQDSFIRVSKTGTKQLIVFTRKTSYSIQRFAGKNLYKIFTPHQGTEQETLLAGKIWNVVNTLMLFDKSINE